MPLILLPVIPRSIVLFLYTRFLIPIGKTDERVSLAVTLVMFVSECIEAPPLFVRCAWLNTIGEALILENPSDPYAISGDTNKLARENVTDLLS
jgi:hypothetical protein